MAVSIPKESREVGYRSDWATPPVVFEIISVAFGGFTLDPCASAQNAKCRKFFTIDDDGLAQSWAGERCFVNPPYGKELPLWAEKGVREFKENGTESVFLIPPRVGTPWFQDFCKEASAVHFLRGRVPFIDPAGHRSSPQDDNCLVIFDRQLSQPLRGVPFMNFWDWKTAIAQYLGTERLDELKGKPTSKAA